jgi:hypothetical protein
VFYLDYRSGCWERHPHGCLSPHLVSTSALDQTHRNYVRGEILQWAGGNGSPVSRRMLPGCHGLFCARVFLKSPMKLLFRRVPSLTSHRCGTSDEYSKLKAIVRDQSRGTLRFITSRRANRPHQPIRLFPAPATTWANVLVSHSCAKYITFRNPGKEWISPDGHLRGPRGQTQPIEHRPSKPGVTPGLGPGQICARHHGSPRAQETPPRTCTSQQRVTDCPSLVAADATWCTKCLHVPIKGQAHNPVRASTYLDNLPDLRCDLCSTWRTAGLF